MKAHRNRPRVLLGPVLAALAVLSLVGCKTHSTKISISAAATPTSTTVGSVVHIKGKVSPARPGTRVVIQRWVDGAWSDRTAGTTNASNSYDITLRPAQAATYKLRVRRAATGSDAVGASGTVTLTVRPAGPMTVSISKGPIVQTSTCNTSPCRYVTVHIANITGTVTVECWGNYQGWSAWFTYTTSRAASNNCIFGYPGYEVYVKVNGVQSNTITW